MRKIRRRPLSADSLDELRSRQSRIDAVATLDARRRRAKTLWKSRTKSQAGERAFDEIKAMLRAMCNGPRLCMYCERNEATDIEHLRPRSKYPQATFVWENYLLACSTCNSKFKRDEYHEGFMDPSSRGYDLWARWLFDPRTGHYSASAVSDEGAAKTIEILGFDRRRDLAVLRQRHLITLVVGIRDYGRAMKLGRTQQARNLARTLSHLFPALVEWILVEDPSPDIFPDIMDVRKVKERFPEIVRDALG